MLADSGELQHELEQCDGWRIEQRRQLVLSRAEMLAAGRVNTLSGGWRCRARRAALVAERHLPLLDELMNDWHIDAITWLEGFWPMIRAPWAFVNHDRALLERLRDAGLLNLSGARPRGWAMT